jgi:hypothetical protein
MECKQAHSATPIATFALSKLAFLVGFVAETTEAHGWFDEYIEAEGGSI